MATSADKVSKYRELAKDKSLPQAVRDQYDVKATELEQKAYEETKAGKSVSNVPSSMKREGYAKGGVVTGSKMPSDSGMSKMAKVVGKTTPKNVAVAKVSAPKVAPKKTMLAKGGDVKKGCK